MITVFKKRKVYSLSADMSQVN